MGRICFNLDDNYERFLRQQSANLHLSISEFIRQKILQSADSSAKNNLTTNENFVALTAEVLELRKELRIITGALITIMESNGLTVEQIKLAGKEFFKVSILQAVSPEYREIVNRCLTETTNEMIAFIEKNFIRTRRGHAGQFLEYTKNFLAASINHELNRSDELDRHTHIFTPNMTQTEDGKILTIDIKFLNF